MVHATYGQLELVSSDPSWSQPSIPNDQVFTFTFNAVTPSDIADGISIRSQRHGDISGTWTGAGAATISFTPSEPLEGGDVIEFNALTNWSSASTATLDGFRVAARVTGLPHPTFSTSNLFVVSQLWLNDSTPTKHVTVADFNGDGHMDIAATFRESNDVPGSLLTSWGNGDGTFDAFTEQANDISRSHTLKSCDLDGDGDVDIVFLGYGGTHKFKWFLNDGAGNFTVTANSSENDNAWFMDFADLDGDGDLDAVSCDTQNVLIYENRIDEGFGFSEVRALSNDYYYLYAPVVGDFDGDGDTDIAANSFGFTPQGKPEKAFWLENTGGIGGAWVEHVMTEDPTGNTPNFEGFQAGDMDGDGDVDLVGNGSYLFTNDGTGTFTKTTIPGTSLSSRSQLFDFDGDGDLDIITSRYNNATYIYRNNNGSFSTHEIAGSLELPGGEAVAADFNEDGLLDLLIAAGSTTENKQAVYEILPYGGSILSTEVVEGAATLVSQIPAVTGTITERGLAYGTTPTPTTAGTSMADANPTSGSFTTHLTELDANTTYYARSYAVINGVTHYSPTYSFTTPISLSYAVGDVGPAGGIIYYVDELDTIPEFDYLELAPESVQVDRVWGCQGDPNPMTFPNAASIGTADLTGIGEGAQATSMIVAGCDELPNAAYYADSLYLVNGGALYDDWYLPTLGELTAIYDAIQPITGTWGTLNLFPAPPEFIPYSYWSSTEWFDTGQAQYWSPMYSNFTGALAKSQTAKVRPVRAFSEEPTYGASVPTPLVSALMPDTAACTGGADIVLDLDAYFTLPLGSMTYTVTGNPAGGEFTASISGSTFTVDFSGAGDDVTAELTITATSDGGTTAEQSIFVSELAGISISADTTSASTLAATDGAIALTFDGGYPVLEAQGDPCGGVETINYHGVDYDLVPVGDQCWFASNLQTTQFNNGTDLTLEVSNSMYGSGATTPMYANPEGGSSNVAEYGYFYSSAALLSTENNLCPNGFHIPTQLEVMALNTAAAAAYSEGVGALADTSAGAWSNPDGDVTNASGLSMIPSGVRSNVIYSYNDGTKGWMGTSTIASDVTKIIVGTLEIDGASKSLYTQSLKNSYGYPARCLRDEGPAQGSYSPVWDHGPTSASLSELSAGDYTVSVTDALGCSAELNVTVLALDLSPAGDSLAADTVCFGAAALSLDLDTVFAGNPAAAPLTYAVSGGPAGGEFSGEITGSTLTVSFEAAGSSSEVRDTLFITATDANLDSFTLPWVLMERGQIGLTGSVTNLTDIGTGDGAIDVTASNVSYSWSNGATTQDLSSLSAGSYTLTVTDLTTGCTAQEAFSVTQPGVMELVGGFRGLPASSAGAADGAIQASFINGGGQRTITFQGTHGNYDIDFDADTDFFLVVPTGVYYVIGYSDAAGSETTFPAPVRVIVPYEACD